MDPMITLGPIQDSLDAGKLGYQKARQLNIKHVLEAFVSHLIPQVCIQIFRFSGLYLWVRFSVILVPFAEL